MFNIGGQSQIIGGMLLATYLGYGVSMPPVVHAVVCVLGGFAGGAAIGWLVGELKARAGAHEVSLPAALTGVICSSSGVINIAIEGQLLLGATGWTRRSSAW